MSVAPLPYIIIADDDSDDLFFFLTSFCNRYPGYRVETFTDGDQVLEFLFVKKAKELPALIILDYKMPLVSGVDVLRKISGDQRIKGIPVVIMTTSERAIESEECRLFGAAGYFIKPNSENELANIVENIIQILENPRL